MNRMAVAIIFFVVPLGISHADDMRTEQVQFASGENETTIKASIKGYETVDYVLGASAGQTMTVNMETDNLASYFNIIAPGETDAAFFVGSTLGNSYTGDLEQSGDYKVRVYMMRSAARRDETANYTLSIAIDGSGTSQSSSSEPSTRTEVVKFASGTNGTVLAGSLNGGDAVNYVLGARNGQFLNVSLLESAPDTHFNIFMPNGELLYESTKGGANGNSYRGQLYLDGENTITVYSLSTAGLSSPYQLDVRID
ncbi:MAG: hypothetical protein AAGC96_06415 [Pseudomonadota bacterium]